MQPTMGYGVKFVLGWSEDQAIAGFRPGGVPQGER